MDHRDDRCIRPHSYGFHPDDVHCLFLLDVVAMAAASGRMVDVTQMAMALMAVHLLLVVFLVLLYLGFVFAGAAFQPHGQPS